MPMPKINLIGERFGMLTVVDEAPRGSHRQIRWRCLCDCGNERIVYSSSLRHCGVSSCGCQNNTNLLGRRFNRLVVVERAGSDKHQQKTWKCRCDCGAVVCVTTGALIQKHNQSCGCLRSEMQREAHKLPDGEAALNSLYGGYVYCAGQRGYAFDLSKEQFRAIVMQPCHYCGRAPFRVHDTGSDQLRCNGIDQVIPGGGYTLKNILPCCRDCNVAKMQMPMDVFRDWITSVYRHWASKGETL